MRDFTKYGFYFSEAGAYVIPNKGFGQLLDLGRELSEIFFNEKEKRPEIIEPVWVGAEELSGGGPFHPRTSFGPHLAAHNYDGAGISFLSEIPYGETARGLCLAEVLREFATLMHEENELILRIMKCGDIAIDTKFLHDFGRKHGTEDRNKITESRLLFKDREERRLQAEGWGAYLL